MSTKVFSQRFNRELSTLGFPDDPAGKIEAIAKVFGISRHLANAMVFGHGLPSPAQVQTIAEVLEVCPQWLMGKTEKKSVSSVRA
jgi:hypothetical protein